MMGAVDIEDGLIAAKHDSGLDDSAKLNEIALLTHPMKTMIQCFYDAMEEQPPNKTPLTIL